ncbi:MAG: tRNA-wybutosine modification methyltransferase TYW3 [Candidatus Anstonellaceae archaeon]
MNWDEFKEKKLLALKKAMKNNEVDKKIISLLKFLNSQKELVSSSSCSGRVLLLYIKKSKKDAKKFFVWHDKIKKDDFLIMLNSIKNKKYFWLRVEPFILHIIAKDIKNANKVLLAMKKAGVKRGGINYISDKITIEIMGHGQLLVPLYLISDFENALKEINKIMDKNSKKLKKFHKTLKEIFAKN